jgi:hypothetical protein
MRPFCKTLPFFMAGGILLGNCAFRSAAGESKVSEKAAPAESEEIKRLIDQLGSEQFKEREQATQTLSKLGKSALRSLKEAAKSRDPEVRRRARQLVERMEAPPVRSIGPGLEQLLPAAWYG